MKILFIIHALTGGGAERVMTTVMNNLCKRGYDVSLLTDTRVPFAYDIDKRVEQINIHQPCPKGVGRLRRRLWGYHVIRKAAIDSKCDVAVSFLVEMNCTVILSLMGTGIPLICSEHSNILRRYPKFVLLKRNILYHFASVVTVLTHHDYKLIHRRFLNCVRMPNPSDLISTGRLNARENIILAVGRVKQWQIKGFDNLIRAWGTVCNKYPKWELQIAGDYDEKSIGELNQVMAESQSTNVEFLGFRKDIGELMNKAAVFCLSSRVEGLPMALIEAMNRGCCCVAFDCKTGPSEIIKNGFSGILVHDGDVLEMGNALSKVINDEKLRELLANNAPFSVIKYSTERVLNRWIILFNKLVRTRGKK